LALGALGRLPTEEPGQADGPTRKSQLAIEYSYQVRERFPDTWVFWVHASTTAGFEEGYRKIAGRVRIPGWDTPDADLLRLNRNWLCDGTNSRWAMIVDNADDPNVFFNQSDRGTHSGGVSVTPVVDSLSDFLPQSPNGSILITSQSRDLAYKLTERDSDVIKVDPMDQAHVLTLLKRKLGSNFAEDGTVELVEALHYMPLAITQAAAYIGQRAPRMTISKYLRNLHKRDGRASNSIIATCQISFEHIRQNQSSAARLLSLLQNRYQEDSTGDNFEEDVYTLSSYSLVQTNIDGNGFEMHRPVQFSMKRWLELNEEMKGWKEKYIAIVDEAFPKQRYERWKICEELFAHAKLILEYQPTNYTCLTSWASILHTVAEYAQDRGSYKTAEELTDKR
jgi:hypothetical protein